MNKSKRIWVSLIVATSIILLTPGMAFADSNNLQINVDGKEVVTDVAPQLKNMVTYVPISFMWIKYMEMARE